MFFVFRFSELAEDEVSNPKAKYRTPVIVMEGVNHGQFASGEMPSNVATHDLPPDVTNMTAYSQIANYTCSFIFNILRNDTESQQILDGGYRNTYNLLQVTPYVCESKIDSELKLITCLLVSFQTNTIMYVKPNLGLLL